MTVFIKPFNEKYISVSFPDKFNDTILNAVRTVPNRMRQWESENKWILEKSCSKEKCKFLHAKSSFGSPAFLLSVRKKYARRNFVFRNPRKEKSSDSRGF